MIQLYGSLWIQSSVCREVRCPRTFASTCAGTCLSSRLTWSAGTRTPWPTTRSRSTTSFCHPCSPSEMHKDEAWDRLSQHRDCCLSFFARRFRAWHGGDGGRSKLVAEKTAALREQLVPQTTQVSESNHAHTQKLLSKSQKPISLATMARKVFLSRLASGHARHGGNAKWAGLADKDLIRLACSVPREGVRLCLEDGLAQPGSSTEVQQVGGSRSGASSSSAVVPAASGGEQQKSSVPTGRSYLNPVMLAFNNRQKAAKLLGVSITKEWRDQTMAELKKKYAEDPKAHEDMVDKFKEYQRLKQFAAIELEDEVDEPIASTFWGWGSKSCAFPIDAVKNEIKQNGLPPSSSVWGEEASDPFRVKPEELELYDGTGPMTTIAYACGASLFNECRRSLRGHT